MPDNIQLVLVEDSSDDAELTMMALKESKLINDIIWLKDGKEAMDYLLKEGRFKGHVLKKPKVILLDLKLPRLSGIEVLERIKSDKDLKKIPVVIMTSSNENKDLDRCYELGVNSYVVKPIDFSQFMEVIKGLILYWISINHITKDEKNMS
ncbi:MAG: response regulator [Cyclobacteriaceae bacterium]